MDSLAKGWWQHSDGNVEISSKNAGMEVVSSFKPRKWDLYKNDGRVAEILIHLKIPF